MEYLQDSWLRRTAVLLDRNRQQDVYGTILTGMLYYFPPVEGAATPNTPGVALQVQSRTAEEYCTLLQLLELDGSIIEEVLARQEAIF